MTRGTEVRSGGLQCSAIPETGGTGLRPVLGRIDAHAESVRTRHHGSETRATRRRVPQGSWPASRCRDFGERPAVSGVEGDGLVFGMMLAADAKPRRAGYSRLVCHLGSNGHR